MTLKLDTNGDLAIENTRLVLIQGADEVRQMLQTRLLTVRGEWFLNLLEGVPYYEDFFKKQVNINIITSVLKKHIRETRGVLKLLEFNIDSITSDRLFSVNFSVQSQDGNISTGIQI